MRPAQRRYPSPCPASPATAKELTELVAEATERLRTLQEKVQGARKKYAEGVRSLDIDGRKFDGMVGDSAAIKTIGSNTPLFTQVR